MYCGIHLRRLAVRFMRLRFAECKGRSNLSDWQPKRRGRHKKEAETIGFRLFVSSIEGVYPVQEAMVRVSFPGTTVNLI